MQVRAANERRLHGKDEQIDSGSAWWACCRGRCPWGMGSGQRTVPARALRHTAVMSEESARLARALIEFREAEGISERELARRTWLSEATIRTFERDRGDLPTPTVARSFEEVLGWALGSIQVTPSEAMGRESSADSAMDLE